MHRLAYISSQIQCNILHLMLSTVTGLGQILQSCGRMKLAARCYAALPYYQSLLSSFLSCSLKTSYLVQNDVKGVGGPGELNKYHKLGKSEVLRSMFQVCFILLKIFVKQEQTDNCSIRALEKDIGSVCLFQAKRMGK